jgi:hypothetical protein
VTNPLGDLQRAIYTTLTDALSVTVHDFVPENVLFPDVTIGEGWTAPFNWHGRLGYTPEFDVNVWSRARGMSEANAIGGQIVAALNYRFVEVDGWGTVQIRTQRIQAFRDVDQSIRHVVVTCRCLMQSGEGVTPGPKPPTPGGGNFAVGNGPPEGPIEGADFYLDLDSGAVWSWQS